DWESAREHAPPLWDLLFLLTDSLPRLDRVTGEGGRDEYVLALFRGELDSSTILFFWLHRAIEALSIPAEAVGPLALLLWLDRAAAEERLRGDHALVDSRRPGRGPFGRLAERWLTEPGLGVDWSARR